jgi:hypothetical protein
VLVLVLEAQVPRVLRGPLLLVVLDVDTPYRLSLSAHHQQP